MWGTKCTTTSTVEESGGKVVFREWDLRPCVRFSHGGGEVDPGPVGVI